MAMPSPDDPLDDQIVVAVKQGQHQVRLYHLSPETILVMLTGWRVHQYVDIEDLDIPDGAKVLGVQFSFERQTFELLVEHESFDPVPDGMLPPDYINNHRTIRLRKLPVEDDAIKSV